ncbi:MAG TPA: HAMP domain-containing sensor histidine kinase [Flexivirga sp.]|uniref:sensor histidine kinase n=1 Tax=Flexivirga sp. TaxID=1962927 RepID=UPI002B68E16F|nr:HAMP domain-containing sensor histidine kinase [Flexivirga sp.]HWC22848.1 HAMP domain-containing sensor histidine kinase [Flexivirga sp.]
MVLLVGVALGGSILVTAQIVSVRADTLAAQALEHEVDSFHMFAASPTGQARTTVDSLLTRYLTVKVADRGETLFTTLDGKPHRRSAGPPAARLDTDRAFIARIAGARKPISGWWGTSAGRVRYGVIPVTVDGDAHRGALVIAEFRDEQAKPLFSTVRIFAIVGVAALAVAALCSWLVAGRVLEPVRWIRQTAEGISETDLGRRIPVRGRDDVARLSRTFNHMLDRLQSSFVAQRRFIDDTTHELRTPITVVRGHLELMGDDPGEREETKALLLDELDRMRRIVEDLADLARSERPDFLVIGEVDLADLTVDVLTTVRVMADRQWAVDEVAEGVVLADGQRLTQALIQFVSNAVRHTDDGDRIAIGSSYVDDRVHLWVDDSGTGVDPADAEHIFERFHRGAGARRVDGAGLGLSIVASIAHAHGGTASLVDRPGPGARFIIVIPARRVSPLDDTPPEDPA